MSLWLFFLVIYAYWTRGSGWEGTLRKGLLIHLRKQFYWDEDNGLGLVVCVIAWSADVVVAHLQCIKHLLVILDDKETVGVAEGEPELCVGDVVGEGNLVESNDRRSVGVVLDASALQFNKNSLVRRLKVKHGISTLAFQFRIQI